MIDTNIAIFYMKGMYDLGRKFDEAGEGNCFISEITLIELKFGVEKSTKPDRNRVVLENFLSGVQILPIFPAIDLFAKEKARLQRAGTPVDDFDLLIACTGLVNDLVVVTNNTGHFDRVAAIKIEDWTK